MKPRILMITPFFYPHLGGAEQQTLELAKCLIERGISVYVLTRKTNTLTPREFIQGIIVHRAIRTIQTRFLFSITYMASVLWFLYRHRAAYDIIHCHILGLHAAAAVVFKILFRKKVLIKIAAAGRLRDFETLKSVRFGSFLLALTRHADKIITVCSLSTQETLQESFPPAAVAQIPNGVDVQIFMPDAFIKKIPGKITFIGRLDIMKGVHVLLHAYSRLLPGLQASAQPGCLYIIGDGPEKKCLMNMAQQLGIGTHVVFTGEISTVISHLQESELFVCPSFSEGLSNVLLEAMACGLPVIATRVGGAPDLITDGKNGMLVDPENIEQLARGMELLLNNKQMAAAFGAAARNTILQHFTIQQTADRYMSVYQSLLSSD